MRLDLDYSGGIFIIDIPDSQSSSLNSDDEYTTENILFLVLNEFRINQNKFQIIYGNCRFYIRSF